ncbi:MAG: hypothetical protein SPD96_06140, partial [Paludibacteraceae bacterium]|nr:hypothetical protein [Paludibacteraceae bacterium]
NITIEIFEKEMVHKFNPKDAAATTTLQGTYEVRARIPENAAWNAERNYYMQFIPDASVNQTLLSWTNDIAEWYKISDKKATAKIKLYAQKATETTTSNDHEAGWGNADKVKATIRIYNPKTGETVNIKRQVAGRNITFDFPLNHDIEEGSTKLKFTVNLESETGNTTAFNHYVKPTENTIEVLYGNYENAGNLYNEPATAEGTSTKTFEIKQSAKMLFYYYENGVKTSPAGYAWDVSEEI